MLKIKNMRIISLLLLLLITVAATAQDNSFVPPDISCNGLIIMDDLMREPVGCPTIETALQLLKEDPMAYLYGEPEGDGVYGSYGMSMAYEILRQGYAPKVMFSQEERDALADELVQIYLHGTDVQAKLALSELSQAADPQISKYGHDVPYTRGFDLLYEIYEVLAVDPAELICMNAKCSRTAGRANSVLGVIRASGGQEGREYAARAVEAAHKAWEASERRKTQRLQN